MAYKHTQDERLDTYYESIGKCVRKVREDRNQTQKEMAAQIGYSWKHISSVENGHRKATLDFLITIEEKYGVSIDSMLHDIPTDFRMKLQMDPYRIIIDDLPIDSQKFVKESIRIIWERDYPGQDFDARLEEIRKEDH